MRKNSVLHLSLSLFLITFVVAVMLSIVNHFTAPIIESSEQNSVKSSLELLYEGADFEKIEIFSRCCYRLFVIIIDVKI